MRDLVYRVYDLPPSMRPLVYDFGQLSPDAEESYIHQIVQTRVRTWSQSEYTCSIFYSCDCDQLCITITKLHVYANNIGGN